MNRKKRIAFMIEPDMLERLSRKKRVAFVIEPDVLERLRAMAARTSLSTAEQIRQAIRSWLEAREWPVRRGDRRARRIE